MMLDAMSGEDAGRAIVETDRQRDGHGTFGEFKASAFILRYLQQVSREVELPAGHAKGGMIVNFHAGILLN
jgi:hypothetical protein